MGCTELAKEILGGRDIPAVHEWLEDMAPSLESACEASRRTRFFVPLAVKEGALLKDAGPDLTYLRHLTRALHVRSAIRLQSGDIDGAAADMTAIFRLARLSSQQQSLVCLLFGIAMEDMATGAAENIAIYGNLPPERALGFAEDIGKLPRVGDWTGAMNYERLIHLEMTWQVASGQGTGASPPVQMAGLDFNEYARRVNWYFDRITGIKRSTEPWPDHQTQSASRVFALRAGGILTLGVFTREMVDRQMGYLTPTWGRSNDLFHQVQVRKDLVRIAMLLAAFHAETGSFPDNLDTLASRYRVAIPNDPFGDGPFKYDRDGQGYVLYSMSEYGFPKGRGPSPKVTIRSATQPNGV